MVEIKDVVEFIREMQEDNTVPKNVKTKLSEVENMLNGDDDNSMKINRAVDVFVEISDDVNLQPDVRTRILNVASMLESL
ncbi:MAG: UPF0147 family protein [Candidatus Woesearchaeota archaeon]